MLLICDTFRTFRTLAPGLALKRSLQVEPTWRLAIRRNKKITATGTGLARTKE